jgi:UDP-glucose 4-epimerase
MKILITGGAGYIGSHASKTLACRGYYPIIVDNLVHGHKEFTKWGTFIEGDLADKKLLRTIFAKYPIAAVMHFAGYAYVGESMVNPAKYYTNNVSTTLNLLETMREAHVGKIIFSSSCATYGLPNVLPITEEHAQNPINPYGRSKLMAEQILGDFCAAYKLRHVILRYFNAAGADPEGEIGELHDPETHLIPLALAAAAGRGPALKVFGTDYETSDGTCIRDYIHVNDLANAHHLALDYLVADGASCALNLGNGAGFSVREIVSAIEQITGNVVPTVEEPRRRGDPPILVGSTEKAWQTLGWQPRHTDLEDILETAWNWTQRRISQ